MNKKIILAAAFIASVLPNLAMAWSIKSLGIFDGASSDAYGINNSGQVIGYYYHVDSASLRPFITGPNGEGMSDLGTLGGRGLTFSYDINDSGQVVGHSSSLDNRDHAFITGPDGVGMADLGTLGGLDSFAHGINNSGQAIGDSWTTSPYTTHAFITGPNGIGMTDLGTLGGTWSMCLEYQ
ncbi:hypothetical protein [Nitrosomonas oligotropha]|uniref:hypothetical protein n=1 Tax=Nitrosomonas oligotropha TaxID=42354 RepID=UPI00136FBC9C|nr:hypothetical protein [Nitrosomonas oligotropha]MXS82168.1 hypothetical protein [Nitrosomonas oligotropha]